MSELQVVRDLREKGVNFFEQQTRIRQDFLQPLIAHRILQLVLQKLGHEFVQYNRQKDHRNKNEQEYSSLMKHLLYFSE